MTAPAAENADAVAKAGAIAARCASDSADHRRCSTRLAPTNTGMTVWELDETTRRRTRMVGWWLLDADNRAREHAGMNADRHPRSAGPRTSCHLPDRLVRYLAGRR